MIRLLLRNEKQKGGFMPWFTDALRIVGAVGGAALVATGVASPLGGALIGAAASGLGNAGADLIEKGLANDEADKEALRAKQQAEAALNQQLAESARRAKEAQKKIDADLRQAKLAEKVLKSCKKGKLDRIPALVKDLKKKQLKKLGLTPLAKCPSADVQQKVLKIILKERSRRGL